MQQESGPSRRRSVVLGASALAAAVASAARGQPACAAATEAQRNAFFDVLLAHGPDRDALRRAAINFTRDPSDAALQALAGPARQSILRRINQAAGGAAALVAMRADLAQQLPLRKELGLVDADSVHVFASWFNRSFLELRRIGWDIPATVLLKLIRYEAVHAIKDWDDLCRRLDPPDRRCFAFFHPNLPEEPLIFVEVALTTPMPAAIRDILVRDGGPLPASDVTTAVFYSISNCQGGLRGIAFGNLLIKQAAAALRAGLPGLRTFCTLSPVPGFRRWLDTATGNPALAPLLDRLGAAGGSASGKVAGQRGADAGGRALLAGSEGAGRQAGRPGGALPSWKRRPAGAGQPRRRHLRPRRAPVRRRDGQLRLRSR